MITQIYSTFDKREKTKTMEQRAQEIIKQHLSKNAPSYIDVKNKLEYTGYMEVYLRYSKNNKTMSSAADYNVMLELASIDKFRDLYTIFNSLL